MSNISEFESSPVIAALSAFVLKFCQPQLEQRQVIAGQQNNNSLPKGTNEFVIITPLLRQARGTALEKFEAAPGADFGQHTLSEMRIEDVQLDFYGPHAAQRASAVSVLAGTQTANEFLKGHGMALSYAGPVRNLNGINASREYTNRRSITVHLCLWGAVKIETEYFNTLETNSSEVLK